MGAIWWLSVLRIMGLILSGPAALCGLRLDKSFSIPAVVILIGSISLSQPPDARKPAGTHPEAESTLLQRDFRPRGDFFVNTD